MRLLEYMKNEGLQAYHPKRKQRVSFKFGAFEGAEHVHTEGRGKVLKLEYYSEAQMFAMLPDLHFPLHFIEAIEKEFVQDEIPTEGQSFQRRRGPSKASRDLR
jgi:hypothetical protein